MLAEALLHSDDYRLMRSISKGGMGAVYLAADRRAFDRLCVAKKMLEYYDPSDPEERASAQERFEEEGRTLASLSHPGIPKIYSFFSENGSYYIVMEYIQGKNLESFVTRDDGTSRILPEKRLPREEVIRYTIQVCHILEYLHSRQKPVVHQDVKPANLILDSQLGQVRLVDFGTARADVPQDAKPGNGPDSSVYGTAGYAAPEQYQGKPVPRSDVFALAATAYHLLTDDDPRDHPFKWPKLDMLPRELGLALKRALRISPEKRSTARELRQALEALSMPQRTLEAFTFPGGTQIRSVGALPALSDEHWDAARSFLYKGDFQRWLRDINRLDLVTAADEIVKQESNHDAGLETFLHIVDPGLPHPKIVVDPTIVDLGGIARESALLRRATVLCATRGYALAQVSSSQPWLELHPETIHLWAGIPADIRINVRAENLPLRRKQQGLITIQSAGLDAIEVPVTARVSLTREIWRLTWRAVSAAVPESWRMLRTSWRMIARVTRVIKRPFIAHRWLFWLTWALMSIAIGAGLYYLPVEAAALPVIGQYLQMPPLPWTDYVSPVLLGPPLIVSILWLAFLTASLLGGAIYGGLCGAWKSFVK